MINVHLVQELINFELDDSNNKFPQFHSAHEGYAVLKEEFDETNKEFCELEKETYMMWEAIKDNQNPKNCLIRTKQTAVRLIQEAIQVAAMCDKFMSLYD